MSYRSPLIALTLLLLAPLPHPVLATLQDSGQEQDYANHQAATRFGAILSDLDAFWSEVLQEAGAAYQSPGIVSLDQRIETGCGPKDASNFAFYCRIDATIYYSPSGFAVWAGTYGDFAPVVVTAHEWGHHIQALLRIPEETGSAAELQADCLAGVYASNAGQQGLLDPGDITAAVASSAGAADPIGLPQDAPGSHGNTDDRIIAFMRGYLDGAMGCGLPLAETTPAAPQPPMAVLPGSGQPAPAARPAPPAPSEIGVLAPPLALATLVPPALSLSQGQPFRIEEEGTKTLNDIAAGFADPTDTTQQLRGWGWEGAAYRIYASDAPPRNAVGWVELDIHRFATVDAAAEALPYFVQGRMATAGLHPVDLGLFGDQAMALTGPAFNGNEVTIYARRGRILVRVTGITPRGDPTADVIAAVLIPLRQLVDEPRVVSPELFASLPAKSRVPSGLRLAEEHARSASTIASTFPDPSEAEGLFQSWGWRESAARVFVADGAGTAAGTTHLELSVFRLADARAAAAALPYFLDARAAALGLSEIAAPQAGDEARAIAGPTQGGREVTVYVRSGANLFRFTGIGLGDPMADLEGLLG
jgi:hypothetical protein